MTKRNPTSKAKHRAGPKTAAKTQRVAEAVDRSPKDHSQRSAETAVAAFLREEGAGDAAGSTSALDRPEVRAAQDQHNEQYPLVEDSMTAFQQEARPEPSTALQNDRLNNPTTGIDLSSAMANVQALQAKLGEVAQANIQFTFVTTSLRTTCSSSSLRALTRSRSTSRPSLPICVKQRPASRPSLMSR